MLAERLTTDTVTVSMQGLTCAFAEGALWDLISILNTNSFALVIPFVVFILLSHSLNFINRKLTTID